MSGYPGLFAICALAGVILPFPEDIALLYAGIRVADGHFGWAGAAAVACTATLLRDVGVYLLGRALGESLLTWPRVVSILGEAKIERARGLVEKHGTASVLIGRFLPGGRTPVFLVAGAAGVGFRKFVGVDALGILVAVPGMMLVGVWVGAPILDTAFWLMRSSRWAMGTVVVLVLAYIAWTASRRGMTQS